MQTYLVDSIHCAHCARAIEHAVKELDSSAKVEVDIAQKTVRIDSRLDQNTILGALDDAGYDDAKAIG